MTQPLPLINPEITADWIRCCASGSGVRIAVIDSGVDATHPDLAGRIVRACEVQDEPGGGYACREIPVEASRDSFGHGTAVAGVIALIAPGAQIVSVKMLNQYNRGSGEALVAGLAWALEQGVDVVNLSLATSKKTVIPILFELCERAYTRDALLVASKRNLGDIGCPAMFSSVISVDNGDFSDVFRLRFLPKSTVEFAARGTNVRVPAPGGTYELKTGTSFATPHVTGIVALLRELFPQLTSWEAKAILRSLASESDEHAVPKVPAREATF